MFTPKRMFTLLAVLAVALPTGLAAQQFSHYKFYDLGTFGGQASFVSVPTPYASVLNNLGTVAGWADFSTQNPSFCLGQDCSVAHAFQWQNGVLTDLGVLGGGLSDSQAFWISSTGQIAGMSQNGIIDPSFTGFPEMRAVLWTNGNITDLGTLAQGNESAALAVNKLGQVVGASTKCGIAPNCKDEATALFDPNAFWGWNKPTRAFLWQNGAMQDLGTLGGSDAAAVYINDNIQNNGVGQIVGESYINGAPSAYCSQIGASLTTGAFLWQNGKMQNLGSFGGTCTYPVDLNDLGEVVGISTENVGQVQDAIQNAFYWDGTLHKLPNAFVGPRASGVALNNVGVAVGFASLAGAVNGLPAHAALWMNSTSPMIDLGTVAGDTCSFAFAVNLSNQVVGLSWPGCDFSQSRAFVWQKGSMVDLNTLIPASSNLYLVDPETINDRGEIAGIGVDASGNPHAFLLIPCGAGDSACQGAPAGPAFKPSKTKIKFGFARTGSSK